MGQLIVLNLGKGGYAQGCTMVVAQFWRSDCFAPMQFIGSLPPIPELSILSLRWQQLYEGLYAHRGWRRLSGHSGFEVDETDITHISQDEFSDLCREMQQCLNRWLNADGFREIDRQIRTHLVPTDEIRVIFTAEDRSLLRLPWHLWQFFADYPKAEPALSLPTYSRSVKTLAATPHPTIKILAILGNTEGINVDRDRVLLEQIPDATLTLLVEPTLEELNQALWHTNYDLLFFAGHSSSQQNSSQQQGQIQINRTNSLTLEQLRYGLKRSIEQGLKLAIFNSCDGLGLAWDLADLQIPQVIVMREPVPDRVAQEFLRHFLTAFARGYPLHLAVRQAREKLQGLEDQFPCATWLPVICQNPAEVPLTWQEWKGEGASGSSSIEPHNLNFRQTEPEKTEQQIVAQGAPAKRKDVDRKNADKDNAPAHLRTLPKQRHTARSRLTQIGLASGVAVGLVVVLRFLGLLQPLELWAFDRLLTMRPHEQPDDRFLIVTIDEAEIQAQNPNQRRGSLSDQALDQLMAVLKQHQPRVIGLDLYRDFAASPQYTNLINTLKQDDRFIAICKSKDAEFDPTGIAPPPEVPQERVGFSDFLEDSDGVLRRQILSMESEPTSPCATPYSFSVQLAFQYLEPEQLSVKFTSAGDLQIGGTVFHRLQERSSGYQSIDAAGNQILLNYRSLSKPELIAPQVTLTDLLSGKVRDDVIRDRIVLIGVTATSGGDFWNTPYGTRRTQRVAGVFVQAQMTSQLLSAVLDQRPLLWVWSGWIEIIWIWSWGIVGGVVVALCSSILHRGIAGASVVATLTGISFGVLLTGGWIPLIPAGIAVLLTGGIVAYLKLSR